MGWASKAAERAFAVRVHTAECICEGRLSQCDAYKQAYASKKRGRAA